jgi:hypothetical protein
MYAALIGTIWRGSGIRSGTVAKRRHHSGLCKPPHRTLFGDVEHDGAVFVAMAGPVLTRFAHMCDQAIGAGVCRPHHAVVTVDDDAVHGSDDDRGL